MSTAAMREWRALLAALLYFTRLPLPIRTPLEADDWRRATSWWPLVGIGVGAATGGVLILAGAALPPTIAAGLSLGLGLLLTGAQHEDGFADSCDGFGGGGPDRARVLEIMRDSRVGAFAVVGLIVLLGLKWLALGEMHAPWLLAAPIAAAALSRAAAAALMAVLSYARTEPSRAAPVTSRLRGGRLALPLLLGLLPLLALPAGPAFACAGVAITVWAVAAAWLSRRLGGYTGDCLGATQQIAEVALLLTLVASL
ncbi:Cobalamin synthase [Magnetospirillum molischianum DSM 120]|uniref:Adenosylcobinamide-GDP ribazoletransferase n=2 Tax=Magnetospirillum molischianum TaxID=1083 RepID=H8FPC7_MAGML|nr:Cobalamin synthase [Magnetospirillum molischianum DSM 120]